MIAAVVCYDMNNAIGYKGQLLFKSKHDMAHFKEITTGHTIIAGRKTYESFQVKPLPNRTNIVITHNKEENTGLKNPILCTMPEVIYLLDDHIRNPPITTNENIFIVGGASIYKQLLPFCDVVYATEVLKDYKQADSYFPKLNYQEWRMYYSSNWYFENDTHFRFVTYVRYYALRTLPNLKSDIHLVKDKNDIKIRQDITAKFFNRNNGECLFDLNL